MKTQSNNPKILTDIITQKANTGSKRDVFD